MKNKTNDKKVIADTKALKWLKENKEAINEYNERIAKYGTFAQSIKK